METNNFLHRKYNVSDGKKKYLYIPYHLRVEDDFFTIEICSFSNTRS